MTLLLVASAAVNNVGPDGAVASVAATGADRLVGFLTNWLNIPIQGASEGDVRPLFMPAAAAAGLLLLTFSHQRVSGDGSRIDCWLCHPVWFGALAGAVVVTAAASSWLNHTTDYSRGWIVQFLTGVGWAALLRKLLSPADAMRGAWLTLGAGAIVLALSLWCRYVAGLEYFIWPIGPVTPTAAIAGVVTATAAGAALGYASGAFRLHVPTTFGRPQAADASEGRTAVARARSAQRAIPILILISVSLPIGLAVLWLAARRAAAVGVVAGVCVVTCAVLLRRFGARRGLTVLVPLLVASMFGAAFWMNRQISSDRPEIGGSVSYRLVYWRESLQLIARAPWLGGGPDSFESLMTPRLARRRAEQPHVLHGSSDPAAHSEWLQAAVELGVPGGLAYVLLPIATVFALLRSIVRSCSGGVSPASRTAASFALAAAITAIVVSESASTSLRGPILPAWYWTCVGLALAASGVPVGAAHSPTGSVPHSGSAAGRAAAAAVPPVVSSTGRNSTRAVSALLAVVLVVITFGEVRRIRSYAAGKRAAARGDWRCAQSAFDAARGRLGFSAWIAAETDQARAILARAMIQQSGGPDAAATAPDRVAPLADAACARWLEICARFSGLWDIDQRCVEALLAAGRREEARDRLHQLLTTYDPYDSEANLTWVWNFAFGPADRLDRMVAALRSTGLSPQIGAEIAIALADAGTAETWRTRLTPLLDQLAAGDPAAALAGAGAISPDGLAAERLRAEAFRLATHGDLTGAIAVQSAAAAYYRLLYESNSPVRRRADAEWDAWFVLARLTYQRDPADAARACNAIEWAERFVLLGDHASQHVRPAREVGGGQADDSDGRDPAGGLDFLGDRMLPGSTPPAQQPFWRAAAKLRLAAGRDRHLLLRAMLALPLDRRNPRNAEGLIAELAGELVHELGSLAPDRRPAHFSQLARLAAASGGEQSGGGS